jgi:hypothetical protein
MFTTFLAAARYKLYVAIAMTAWSTLYPHGVPKEAPIVADAIAWAALTAPTELPDELQDARLVATMAVYAARETDLRAHPCVGRKDPSCADGGLAGGYWSLHQPAGFSADARVQATAWVELVRQAQRMCGTSTGALAMTASGYCHRGLRLTASRLRAVETVLQVWNGFEKGSAGTPSPADASLAVPSTAQPTSARRSTDEARDPGRAVATAGAEL